VTGGGAGPAAGDVEPLDEPLAWTRAPRRVPRSRGGTAARVLADEEPEVPASVEPLGDVPMDVDSEMRGALDALRELGGDSPTPSPRHQRELQAEQGAARQEVRGRGKQLLQRRRPTKKAAAAATQQQQHMTQGW
jgi:hypothetical protein